MKDKLFLFGITLMTTSFLACVISFWLLVFGIPVFIGGVILLWFSKKTTQTKRWLTFIPVLTYVPATYLFLLAYNYSPPQTFLIPADYKGMLRILYEEPCGITPERKNGQKTLTFPKNGILILNTDFDHSLNIEYFLVDEKGNRRKINGSIDAKARLSKSPVVVALSSGTRSEATSNTDPDRNPKRIVFSDFYVFNTDTTDYLDHQMAQKLDSLTDALVQACRQK